MSRESTPTPQDLALSGSHGRSTRSRWWSFAIGIGISLIPVHNWWLTQLCTNSKGETWFFLPTFGWLVLIMGIWMFMSRYWGEVRRAGLRDKKVYIPMLVIVGAMGLSGLGQEGIGDTIAPLGMGIALFALYLSARILGKAVLFPVAVGALVASVGVILFGFINRGTLTGGYVFEHNYDIVVGYVLLGVAVVTTGRYRWVLVGVGVLAMFVSGSPEGLFSVAVLGAVVLWRRDWSKRMALAFIPVVVVATTWLGAGWGQELYSYIEHIIRNDVTVVGSVPINSAQFITDGELTRDGVDTTVINWRLIVIDNALHNLKPLGDGYNITSFSLKTVHNVPLIIVQQLGWAGVLAGLAWLWVTVYCLVKTRWKYAFVLLLSLSVFDHFVWTQMAPLWWAIAGVSLASQESDLLFRTEKVAVVEVSDEVRGRYGQVAERYNRILEQFKNIGQD